MVVKELKVKTLDQIVVLPNAENTFDLKEEDFRRFKRGVLGLFGNYFIDSYILDEKGEWLPEDNNPLKLVKVERLVIPYRTYNESDSLHPDAVGLRFTHSQGTYRFIMDFRGHPRFAFLNDKADPSKLRGLYVSVGNVDGNPWANRDSKIYVIRK